VSGDRISEASGAARLDALQPLRERVLRRTLGFLAFAVPGVSLIIISVSLQTGHFDPTTIALSLYTLSFPTLWLLRPRLGMRASAIALLALLALTGFLVEARGGVGTGNILLNALVLLLGALFFGRRGAALGLIVVVALFVLAGLLVLGGYVPPVTKSMWDSTTPGFWLRDSVALLLMGLAIAIIQVYIMERLAGEAARLQSLVEKEQQQRLALENAERERQREREHRVRAQRALEESQRIEALARMAGGIAHDFNNSLTVVMGAADEIGLATSLPEAKERAREIAEAARHTADLTHQLLTLGRRQVSRPQPVRLASQWDRLRTAFRRILPDDIALDMAAPSADLVVNVDPADLARAVLNLVLNARDAMPRGGQLRIQVGERLVAEPDRGLPPGRYAEISVSDQGEGIPDAIRDRMFEPFFTTKPVGRGTGLGLPTVHGLAKDAGGDLQVESTPGAGATFTLRLPTLEADAPAPRTPERAEPAPPAAPTQTRVLVVEDNPYVRANMAKALRNGGFDVTEAADGDQAMARLDERKDFAVLCSDGVMPGAATRDVIARAENQIPSLRVLLCSGHLQEDLLRRGVATGRYAFLAKPFSSGELLAAVRGLAASARSSPQER
jgi:signal transduction histidine kinase/CheY-like chemotaxis protein